MQTLPSPSPSNISLYDFPVVLEEVRRLRGLITQALHLGGTRSACAHVARMSPTPIGASTLHKHLSRWLQSNRDDTVLIDKRKLSELWQRTTETSALPEEFLVWAGGQMLGNQRKSKPAYREIIRRWKRWRAGDAASAIPGYNRPPKDSGKGYPFGWSYDNLMLRAQPPKEELQMARIGSVAAQKLLPFIPGSRHSVRFLEYIFTDDVVLDRKCFVPGYDEPVRILQLGALCYASAAYLKFGQRPDLPRDDGTRERLQRRDFLTLIAGLLMDYGFPTDYPMHLICERGTATMNRAEAEFLHELSNGQVRVGYTSMEGRFVFAWDEAKSGNSNAKGPIESWHNLFHNEQAHLPGQTGKDRAHSPTALLNSDREVAALNKLGRVLTPAQRAKLEIPYPSMTQAFRETVQIVTNINNRRDHQLEDFEEVNLWRLAGTDMEWRPEGELAVLNPAALSAVEFRPVKETPHERLVRLSQGVKFQRPHPGALINFFEASHTIATITRRQVKITIDGKTVWFGAETPEESLDNGETVNVHHMPSDPEWAIITCKGRYVGTWKRQLLNRADDDADALSRHIQRKQSFIKQTASFVRGRMAEQLREHERRVSQNAAVIEEAMQSPSSETLAEDNGTHTSPVAHATSQLAQRTATLKQSKADHARELREAAAALAAARSQPTDTDTDEEGW